MEKKNNKQEFTRKRGRSEKEQHLDYMMSTLKPIILVNFRNENNPGSSSKATHEPHSLNAKRSRWVQSILGNSKTPEDILAAIEEKIKYGCPGHKEMYQIDAILKFLGQRESGAKAIQKWLTMDKLKLVSRPQQLKHGGMK